MLCCAIRWRVESHGKSRQDSVWAERRQPRKACSSDASLPHSLWRWGCSFPLGKEGTSHESFLSCFRGSPESPSAPGIPHITSAGSTQSPKVPYFGVARPEPHQLCERCSDRSFQLCQQLTSGTSLSYVLLSMGKWMPQRLLQTFINEHLISINI